jgi:hypothetical protein
MSLFSSLYHLFSLNLRESLITGAGQYLAFGFGFQLPEISTYTNGKTLDGLWHTARRDPFLRNSGVGALGDALFYDNGKDILLSFLSREYPSPANCVLVNETIFDSFKYHRLLEKTGWKIEVYLNDQITLWKNNSVEIVPDDSSAPPKNTLLLIEEVLWGILPLLYFSNGFLLHKINQTSR